MFSIMGITGNVGGEVARRLLAAKKPVRAVMRDARNASAWRDRGCEIALADIHDSAALAAAFKDAEGVFVMVPSNFDPLPGFPEAQAIAAALHSALEEARPGRVVYLSTVGAQATRTNLLTQHSIIEQMLSGLSMTIAFLRPAWFMENCSWDIAPARERGIVPSFLQPLDRHLPMVATADIGRVAAEVLQEKWNGRRIVELEGPNRVSPNEIAAVLAELLGRAVRMEVVPHESWETLFQSQGMRNPTPRIQMLDGFNEGWIDFEGGEAGTQKGQVPLKTVLTTLIKRGAE
jgi:NAD(P)H dehydrogenase (quinone)